MKKKAQIFTVPAEGNSMSPLLHSGDRVEYIQVPFSSLQLNDIILIYENKTLVTHRIIYKTNKTCITRGDNNSAADKTIQKDRVLAKAIRFQRKGVWYGMKDAYLMQSALYLGEIQKLAELFRISKIPHVFLKGVLVSLRYEGTIPKRIYADCDVLVKRDDQKNIEKIFKMLRYQLQERALLRSSFRTEGEKSRSVLRFAGFLSRPSKNSGLPRNDRGPEVSFMKVVNGVRVVFDVHFEPVFLMTQLGGMNALYSSKKLQLLGNEIIERGEKKRINGYTYSLCSPSDQILYLALHIFHHNFTDSIRYQLLDRVCRKSGRASWKKVAATIRAYQLEGYTYGAFLLLDKYFKTPIPPLFLQAIRPSYLKTITTRLIVQHVDIFSQEPRVKAGIKRFIYIMLLSPGFIFFKCAILFRFDVIVVGCKLIWNYISSIISHKRNE